MPAQRLPWVKLWVESLDHEKTALLPDAEYRTWTTCLLRGSQQPVKWRFASVQHAALVTGRPVKQIKALLEVHHLLDLKPDGLWIHDASHWQDRYPSDFNRGKAADMPAEAPSINEGTLREYSANAPQIPPDDRPRVREEGRGEREIENSAPNGAGAPGKPVARAITPVPKPTRGHLSDAVKAANVLLHMRCDETQRAEVDKIVPATEEALATWEACLKEWRIRGHKVGLRGPLDWFADGIPPGKPQRNGTATNGAYVAPGTAKQAPPPELKMTPEQAAASDAARQRLREAIKTGGMSELRRTA